jgi:hypothetical protein
MTEILSNSKKLEVLEDLTELHGNYMDASNEALSCLLQSISIVIPGLSVQCDQFHKNWVEKTTKLHEDFKAKYDL